MVKGAVIEPRGGRCPPSRRDPSPDLGPYGAVAAPPAGTIVSGHLHGPRGSVLRARAALGAIAAAPRAATAAPRARLVARRAGPHRRSADRGRAAHARAWRSARRRPGAESRLRGIGR